MFWHSLPNDDVKFSYLRFRRKREHAAVNLSFFAFTWKPFVPSERKWSSPILYNVINLESQKTLLTQSSILMWRFPCSCRRSLLNSLLRKLRQVPILVMIFCLVFFFSSLLMPAHHIFIQHLCFNHLRPINAYNMTRRPNDSGYEILHPWAVVYIYI